MTQRDEDLASEMIAARLNDPAFQDKLATARSRETGVHDELIQNLNTLNPAQIQALYGTEAAMSLGNIEQGAQRLRDAEEVDRSFLENASDKVIGAGAAAYRTAGNLSGLGAGALVDWATDGAISREQATADILTKHNDEVSGFLEQNLTEELQEQQHFFEIEGELDSFDNQVEFEREVEAGANPTLAAMRREGKNALDAGERMWNNPAVAGQIISEGIGDLALSVPLAGTGGLIAAGASKLATRKIINDRVQKVITAAGISAGAAPTEVAGVYAEAVNDVMSIPVERLAETSSVYNELMAEGLTPEEARSQLAGMTAETAAIRQLPATMALGFLTSKFEAMPIGSFRGIGVTKGLLSIAGEGVEEAGQGISGTMNRNIAVEDYAQIGRGVFEGVGEEAAIGALAGMGTAGVMAGPATARGTVQAGVDTARSARDALLGEQTFNDPLRQDIMGRGSRASQAASVVNEATRPVRQAAVAAAQRLGGAVVEYTQKPTNKEVQESVQTTLDANESLRSVAEKGQLREEIQTAFESPDVEQPSEGFGDVAGGTRNVFDNVTGIIAKMGSRDFKPTEADTAYAASQIQKISSMIGSMPKDAKKQFGAMLSSKMVQNVISKSTKLDLNKEGAPKDKETIRNVAKVNPTAVDPDATDQILEESGEEISPEDTKLMKAASKLARIVNRHSEAQVKISQDKNINLTASGRKPGKEKNLDSVSRQIFADGFVTEGGKKLRSINDFAREIFTGIQSPDGNVINQETGVTQPVTDVMQDMQNFAQHMVNKVTALNESIADGYVSETGKRGGKLKNFDSPVRGVRREGVRYSPDNPNSVAFAQQVAEEQNAVVDAFNTLREEFPDVLGSFPEMQKVELTPADAPVEADSKPTGDEAGGEGRADPETNQPTGIDEDSSADGSEEQNQKTQKEIDDEEFFRTINRDPEPENVGVDNGFITDENDNVMSFYHGTGGTEFDQFTDSKDGIFLTTRKGQGREYAIGKENPRLMEVQVRATNPLLIEADDPQNHWLTKRGQVEKDYADGGHDAIIITDGNEAIVIAFNGDQVVIVNQNIDARPTAIEEDVESRSDELSEEASDERSESEPDEGNEEGGESASDEQIQKEAENLHDSTMAIVEIKEGLNERRVKLRKYVLEQMGPIVKPLLRQVKVFDHTFLRSITKVNTLGRAHPWNSTIWMAEVLFKDDSSLTNRGKAVAIHEVGHLVDDSNPIGVPYSAMNTMQPGGVVYEETMATRGHSDYVDERLDYIQKQPNDGKKSSELFAILTEFYFSTDADLQGKIPNAMIEMENIYEQGKATGTATDVSGQDPEPVSTDEEVSTDAGREDSETAGDSTVRVTQKFTENFEERTGDAPVTSVKDFLAKYLPKGLNVQYAQILEEILPDYMEAMNNRLQVKVRDSKSVKTVAQHAKDGRINFRRFKAAALMDPETEQYDPQMLELSMLAVMDFIVNASGSDPRKLDDTLERMGLNKLDVTEEGLKKIMFGLPPSQVADSLVNDLTRLWHVKEKVDQKVDDLEGISHGFAKEMLTVLAEMDIIDIETVKTNDDTNKRDAFTIMVNTQKIQDLQKRLGEGKGEGVVNSARETIFNDARESYSIGDKLTTISNTKGRGTGILSDLERKAVQKMQDIPFKLQNMRARLLEQIGEDNLATFLGFRDPESITHPVLRASVLGKNTSIRRDLIEVTELADGMMRQQSDTVYFPVGITKVGRHQMQGPNPQNNKLMRYLVAPQSSTLSTTDEQDTTNFWLGVTQQADLFKAEKNNHGEALRDAMEDFAEKYGPAVEMVKEMMRGNPLDSDAFLAEIGQGEPALLAAIEAVATRELAIENGESEFTTALSFELDGLTNGAANMMVNFGHGLLTPDDWNNFQRIGYFLGKTKQTVTDFFDGKKNKDLYEMVSQLGDAMMTGDLKRLKPWQKEQRMASGRLSSSLGFGNFEMDPATGEFWMTRNTAKNPMTKVNYGSGVQGVAVGVADDMLLSFYEKLQDMPADADWDTYFYPGVKKDMETMGIRVPDNINKDFVFSNDQVDDFRKNIQFTVGKILTNATRQTLGHRIEQLNDMLVLSTNVQTTYLQKLFDQEVDKLAEDLARKGEIGRNKKGEPNKGEIPRAAFRELEDRLGQMGAIFVSDEQTLAVGGFDKELTDLRLSSNFDERLATPARMRRPQAVGVKALPFSVIGTGDAMMMNLIFGGQNAPNDVLHVFDGIDIPVAKIQQYAPSMNEAVLKSWDRDVLGMVVQNFEGFITQDLDDTLLSEAWAEHMDENKKESLESFTGPEDLRNELQRRLKENRARKKVFRELAVSVDQMGGSAVGFSRDGIEAGFTEVNQRIENEMKGKPEKKTDVKTPVQTSSAKAVLNNLRGLTEEQKKTVALLKDLMGDVVVQFGTLDQLNEFRAENYPDDGVVLKAPSQYDYKNNVIFMSKDTNESILHEMVHAATYGKVLEHFQGSKNPAVSRLETLMNEFMDIESDGKQMREAQAAIARRLARNNPVNQAAAVNEFMAYVLANGQVRRKTKQVNVIAKFAKQVMDLARRIMGGVPASMFDHVVFNTRVLNEPNVDDGGNGDTPPPDDPGDETTPPFENHIDYWIENLRQYMNNMEDWEAPKQKTGKDLLNADTVIDRLRQGGFLANSKDRSTFKAIYGIMLSDMNLDPTARIALNRVFEHIVENMTPEMFGSGTEALNEHSAVMNAFGAFTEENASDAAAVLFALSQTSTKMRNVMDQIPAPEGQAAVSGSLQDFLSKAASFSMQKVMGMMDTNNAPQEVLDAIAEVIINHDKDKEFRILNRVTGSLTAADNWVSGKLSSSSEWMGQTEQELRETSQGTVKQRLVSAITLGTNLLDKTRAETTANAAKVVTHSGIAVPIPIREFVTEVVGTDKQNSAVVALLNRVNAAVSGTRQAFREDLPGILEREFQIAPDENQWKSMFKTLAKTDFSVLYDSNSRQPMRLLEERAARTAEITSLENQLQQRLTPSNFADVTEKAQQLAAFMNGQAVGKLLVRNAYAIAKNMDGDFDPDLVPIIDRLTSVYAIHNMDPEIREETVRLAQEDPSGVASIMGYLQYLNAEEDAKVITEQARLNGYKGYIPNEGKHNTSIIVDLDSGEDRLARAGYTKLNIPYEGETDSVFPKSYYISNVRRQGMYSQGVMQNVAMTYRGVDTNTGLTVDNSVAGFVGGDSSIDRIVRNQLDPNTVLENEKEALMPVFAGDGTVMGFERAISTDVQDLHFGRDENLGVMLGAWAGRQVEEQTADQYNRELIDNLHGIWTNREEGSDDQFEDMKTSTDPIYAESWKLVPQATKNYIESKFEGGFMVPKSMVNLAVGYREPSITDMWTGKSRMPEALQKTVVAVTEKAMGRNAMRWLSGGEEVFQGVVSTAKDVIVVRSLVVPVANLQANVVQLANAGIPLKQINKGYRAKLAEAEEYVNNRTKIIDLEQKERIARNANQKRILQDKIQVLKDLEERMTIAPLLKAGQFKQLSEGITDVDVELSSGRLGDYVEKLADKLPESASNVAHVGLVSKSTKLYQVLNRATQYGDFIAKSIYYDHLIDQGLSDEVAQAMINEEFVNYSVLPGRVRSALESNGLTWFMNFKIRILKIAAKQMRDNPVRSLALNMAVDVGGPIEDNLLTVIGEGRLDYSMGFDMLFGAPELNPWLNLISD